jgi:tetratricopeptide (TPR) repeat protein
MPVLRLRHSSDDGLSHLVLVEFEGRVEERRLPIDSQEEVGERLFHALFDNSEIWTEVRDRLGDTRIEIDSRAAIPWELLRDPATGVPLALEARSFVRVGLQAVRPPVDGPLRVLLCGCGPVARRLVEGLRGNGAVQFTVLRPATFEQLGRTLGGDFHLVHFEGMEGIDGAMLGSLLAEKQAGVLVLGAGMQRLAQDVADADVPVVAMPHGASADSAAGFEAGLYQGLLRGAPLAEAVTFARRQRPELAGATVFEAAGFAMAPNSEADIELQAGVAEVRGLPSRPDSGFFGRDDAVRALENAFDRHRVVLLHGEAGSGKTTAAVEFARWYSQSGGFAGAMLFTSFEHHLPLARMLDQAGQVFGTSLQRVRIHWPALEDAQRRQVALDVLRQVPVFWIWDNVEAIAQWTPAEQRELADFCRDARDAGARILLTSTGTEQDWLGELPARIALAPLPLADSTEVALGCADMYSRRLPEGAHLCGLLEFAEGNPLAIVLVVGQAVRDGLRTKDEFDGLAARLQQVEYGGDEGVPLPLAKAAKYVFANSFDEPEHGQLSLLHLFQGLVHVDTLRAMGDAGAGDMVERDSESVIRLLERAAIAGFLNGYGGGYYTVQPSLAWFFRRRFEERDRQTRQDSIEAYVEAMGGAANFYAGRAQSGDRDAIDALRAEQPNLFRARALARELGHWGALIATMQGLRQIYEETGRVAEWRSLVDEIVPDLVDPATDGPLPRREEPWSLLTGYRVEFAQQSGEWNSAERLQRLRVDWIRGRASKDPAGPRTLAVALGTLGQIQREAGSAKCIDSFQEAFEIVSGLGDRPLTSIGAFELGRTYEAAREWDQAESWYRKSMEACPDDDRAVRPKILSQLGGISYERFLGSFKESTPNLEHLENTARFYHQALELTPREAVAHLAVIHNQLGNTYYQAGESERALEHYRESIACKESSGNGFGAATTRYNVALLLLDDKRYI